VVTGRHGCNLASVRGRDKQQSGLERKQEALKEGGSGVGKSKLSRPYDLLMRNKGSEYGASNQGDINGCCGKGNALQREE